MAEETDIKKMKGESIKYLLKFCIYLVLLSLVFCIVVQYLYKHQATTELDILYLLTILYTICLHLYAFGCLSLEQIPYQLITKKIYIL